MAFPIERVRALAQNRAALTQHAEEEVASRYIAVDPDNTTAGMRLHVLEPARAVLAEWRQARAPFDSAIAPSLPAITAVRDLEQKIAAEERDQEDRVQRAEHDLEQLQRYRDLRERYRTAKDLFEKLHEEHGKIDATMAAYNPFYWVALLAIGGAEWLINYDVFDGFLGIPALAAGATLVMGVLLAFAAHGHGTLLKQWSFRFGAQRRSIERHGDWRLFGLSTFALLVVLMAAGGSRYAVVVSGMSGQTAGNLAGTDAIVQFHPLRDVSLSLLANVAAWVVGVFIAYLTHDADPDYMMATYQMRQAKAPYDRMRRGVEDIIRTITAQHDKRERDLRAAAESKAITVGPQHQLLVRIEKHEAAVFEAVAAQVASNAASYHDILAQLVVSMLGECRIHQGSDDLSVQQFRALRPALGVEQLRHMMGHPA